MWKVENYKNAFLVKSVIVALFFLQNNAWAQNSGFTQKYRIMFVNSTGDKFIPVQDITKISENDLIEKDIKAAFLSSVSKSFISFALSKQGSKESFSDLTSKESILNFLSLSENNLKEDLGKLLSKVKNYPINKTILIIPQKEITDFFYKPEKISMDRFSAANVLADNAFAGSFDEVTTNIIKNFKYDILFNQMATLVALKADLNLISPNDVKLNLKVLLKINKTTMPFTEKNAVVEFETLEIPSDDTYMLASANKQLANLPEKSELKITFGEFNQYSKGDFNLHNDKKNRNNPVLRGKAVKSDLVKIKIGINDIIIDLKKAEATNIKTFTQPGLKFFKFDLINKGLNIEKVDEQFRTEVNKQIQSELSKVNAKKAQLIEQTSDWNKIVNDLLNKVLK